MGLFFETGCGDQLLKTVVFLKEKYLQVYFSSMEEKELEILLKCKNDLEVETFVENISSFSEEFEKDFPKTAALIDSPFSRSNFDFRFSQKSLNLRKRKTSTWSFRLKCSRTRNYF